MKKIILKFLFVLASVFIDAQTFVSDFYPNNVAGGVVYSHINGDYLYANTTAGNYFLKIIDISNPVSPFEVASISGNSRDGFCSQVVGDYLFWTNMENGVQIYNISNPANPTFVNSVDTQTNAGGHWQSLAYGLHVDGNYLYVANYAQGSNFQVYDISDISNIIYKDGIHIGDEAKYVDVIGNYAYVANRYNGLKIIDVSDKSNISVAATYDPGQVLGVDVEGDYAYLSTGTGLEIINISIPTSPSLEGSYNTPGIASTVTYDSNSEMAYVADDSNGALIIDVSTSSSPSLYGSYDSSGNTKHISVGSGNAYLSDWNNIIVITAPLPTISFNNSSGDNQWDTPSNWSSGSVPTSSTDVAISSSQTLTVGNSTAALANNLTIDSGGSLTIAANSDLTISGDFTNNGTVTLNSDADEFASIIVQGSSTGDIVYNRYVNTVGSAEWDLIGAPTDGLSISSFVTTNSTPLATSGSIYAVGEYDNSDNSWTNYTSSTVGAAGNFDIGRGYQMATSSGATMTFTGTVATTDQTQSIINNAGNGGRRWNLVANPYPSYLNANTNAHASNNFLSVNSGVIDSNYSAIYGYDADGSGYTIYNNTNAATYIAPGQAFFVAAASSSAANLSFTEAMQTTTGGDDFIAGRLANTSSELYLKLYEGQNLVGDTKFYFDNNLSLGLDPGYDAGAYNQSSALASRLAEDDQGVNMGINAMGIDSFEQTTIPLVINREAGTTFRISMEDSTIPESVEVVLEDTETQTFTNLRTEDFTLNPQNDLSGMGRFYLRLGNTSLGGSDLEESYISIYNPMDKDYITIEGLANTQNANVRLYNIIGQEILSKTLQTGQSTQNISTAGLTTGIYVIKLQVDSTLISKKIVLN